MPWISPIPLRDKPVRPARKPDPVKESGLFSQLSSYLSTYATDEPSPPSDEEIERTMCTVDCIRSCHLEEFSRNLMYELLSSKLMSGNLDRKRPSLWYRRYWTILPLMRLKTRQIRQNIRPLPSKSGIPQH